MITFWICHLYQFNTRQVVHHMFKLNNYRSLSDLTRILLNPNAVRNDLAQSDAPFLSTTGAPKHPVELCRHLTHKIGNASSLSRPKKPSSVPIPNKSPSSQEECGCGRPFTMATPASVHCTPRQHVFCNLSRTGL